MDEKEKIITLISKIDDIKVLKKIYKFIYFCFIETE